jgi:hypothetical protein
MPVWNVKGRPDNPKLGEYGLNVELGKIETWSGTDWV